MAEGVKAYKPFAVEHIGIALAGAKELQAAVKAGDAQGRAGGLDQVAQGLGGGRADHRRIFPRARRGDRRLARRQAGLSRDRGGAVFRQDHRDLARRPTSSSPIWPSSTSAVGAELQFHAAGPAQRRDQARLRGRREQVERRRVALRRHLASSTCRRTSRASRRSTSSCSHERAEEARRQARRAASTTRSRTSRRW